MIYLYLILNQLNNKLYVGLTNNLKRRWREHRKNSNKITKHSYAIHLAMAKYGIDNFLFKTVDESETLEQANEKEMQWIKILKEAGYQLYNETDGGDGTRGHSTKWTDERKKEMSIRNSGSGNPMFGKQFFGSDNPNFGKEMKPHVKDTLLQSRTKLSPSQVVEILKLYATGNYSQTKLSKQFNISLTQIHRVVNGKRSGTNDNKPITKHNLIAEQVIELRKLYETGNYKQSELAKKYNISLTQVGRIIRREKWKDI